jgi:hypothetical protein
MNGGPATLREMNIEHARDDEVVSIGDGPGADEKPRFNPARAEQTRSRRQQEKNDPTVHDSQNAKRATALSKRQKNRQCPNLISERNRESPKTTRWQIPELANPQN